MILAGAGVAFVALALAEDASRLAAPVADDVAFVVARVEELAVSDGCVPAAFLALRVVFSAVSSVADAAVLVASTVCWPAFLAFFFIVLVASLAASSAW
jgi:hypothetical protein